MVNSDSGGRPAGMVKLNPFPFVYLVLGFLLMTIGVAWIYLPAGLLVAGGMLLGAAFANKR